jgi:bifunctional ADP-heptose synthase (sugar kinase/adenylyltransferase)
VADQITQDEQGRTFKNGVLQTSSSPSLDVTGAIHSMIAALAQAFAPRAVVQRPQAIEQAVNGASGAPQPGLGHEF